MRSIRLRIRGRPEQIKGPPVRDVAELRREPFVEFDVFFLLMSLLPRKGLLAIAAVVDVALQTDGRPISAKTLTTRHGLPRRHLESVLQSLVRDSASICAISASSAYRQRATRMRAIARLAPLRRFEF